MSRDPALGRCAGRIFFLTVFRDLLFDCRPVLHADHPRSRPARKIFGPRTNRGGVYHPTLRQTTVELLTSPAVPDLLSATPRLVSVIVVTITMLISVPAAFRAVAHAVFWGSTMLATGIFSDLSDFRKRCCSIPLFKMFALVNEYTGIQLIKSLVGAAAALIRR